MAKGLRSKSMRKNRTYLRETLVKPLIRERQEKIAEAMKKKIEEQSSSTLLQLKKIIPTVQNEESVDVQNIVEPTKKHNIVDDDDDDNMNVNDDEESSEDEAEATSKFVKKNAKQHSKFGNKKQVVKSSRQSTKEMFWFK